jgi:GNAT superfamily N-acetyltransferase
VLLRYYGWIVDSRTEWLRLVRRDDIIEGAAVISFSPDTVMSRFLRAAPVPIGSAIAARALRSASFRRSLWAIARESMTGGKEAPLVPELLQLFVAEAHQGRGLGAEILAEVEADLKNKEVGTYYVRTLRDGNERTLGFYRRRAFSPVTERTFGGDAYVFLAKRTS